MRKHRARFASFASLVLAAAASLVLPHAASATSLDASGAITNPDIILQLPGSGITGVPPDVSLILDDGIVDNNIGIGGTVEMLFVNRFTPDPSAFPFAITEVSVWFSSSGNILVGDDITLVLYENTTGNTNPAVGSNFLASFDTTVQALDAWNVYSLPTPVTFNGPGDAIIGVIAQEVPGTSYFPGALDQTVSQGRSWVGWYLTSPPPSPPALPPTDTWTQIDVHFLGNWMIRASGWDVDTTLYFSDFESDNGSMEGTLDWVWGEYAWDGTGCYSGNATPPPSAYSGSHMWGTSLNTCYQNRGNNDGYDTCNNTNPADDSILSFTVDLTGAGAVELSWWEWYDVFMEWDWGEVYVNGEVVFQHCGHNYVQPTAWVQQTVDLSPYAGAPVTIEFHMMASSVVNYAGWFIDDVMVAVPINAPNIDVDPLSLAAIQPPDTITQQSLSIGNTGNATLEWGILEEPAGTTAQAPAAPAAVAEDLEWARQLEMAAAGEILPAQVPVAPIDSQNLLAEEMAGIETTVPAQVRPKARPQAMRPLQAIDVLLVPDSTNDRIMALDPATGDVIDADFVPAETTVGTGVHAMLNAAGDRILLSDQVNDVVHEFDLAGNYIGVFAPVGGADPTIMDNIRGMAMRPNGNLLVTVADDVNADTVVEFDTSGNYLGTFVSAASGGLGSPFDIYGRSADWLVGGIASDAIHRYDTAGSYLSDLAALDSFPEQLAEASNGNVLVGNFSGTQEGVVEFTSAGALVGIYNPGTLGGYRGVYELPNGNILTTNSSGVHEIDRSGNLVESKITGISARFIQRVTITDAVCDNPTDVPWLSVSPDNGTTAPGDTSLVDVAFDSTGLGLGTYSANLCIFSNDPDNATDNGTGNGTELVIVPVTLDVVECVDAGDCPDDGLFCTGVPVCDNNTCGFSGDPCAADNETPVCDEEFDMCIIDCELIVKHKRLRARKLTKPRKVVLKVTSEDEAFDIFGIIDPGVFSWYKVKFNQRKNLLKIFVMVPPGLAPGVYQIRVGDCFGEVVVVE